MDLLTQSEAGTFRRCPRQWYLTYRMMLRPIREADYYRVGGIIHWAIDQLARKVDLALVCDGIRANYSEFPPWCVTAEEEYRWTCECETALRMVCGYDWIWGGSETEIVESEVSFDVAAMTPRGNESRGFRLTGKLDRIVRSSGRLGLQETKTTGDSIAPESDYWRILPRDVQIGIYAVAAMRLGYPIEFVQYDVLHKPQQRPKAATPVGQRKYKKDGALYKCDREFNEPPVAYGERITADITERPQSYYARVEVPILTPELERLERDVWATWKTMRFQESLGICQRNPGQNTCPFCPVERICDLRDAELAGSVPTGFRVASVKHEELHRVSSTDQAGTGPAPEGDSGATTQAPAPGDGTLF